MQETLRGRLEQLKTQKQHTENAVTSLNRELMMIVGAINEATACLNHVIEADKKAVADKAAAKEAAKKTKAKGKKKAATTTPASDVSTATEQQDKAA